jgi:hypothetical protein
MAVYIGFLRHRCRFQAERRMGNGMAWLLRSDAFRRFITSPAGAMGLACRRRTNGALQQSPLACTARSRLATNETLRNGLYLLLCQSH